MVTTFKKLLLLTAVCVATGCASTATGISQSSMRGADQNVQLRKTPPRGTTIAVVRYPAFVEEDAKDAYYEAFGKTAIGGRISSYNYDSPEVQAIADSVVLKSNYFALSLYKELAARLPEHSVLLSPHTVKLGDDGKLTSEPMTQAESLAKIVSVDFSAYTFPDPKKMMDKQPLTFGDLVTPIVSVHTDHRASAPTQGLRMASAPIIERAARNGQDKAADSLEIMQNGQLKPVVRELDFIAHLKGDTPLPVAAQDMARGVKANRVQSYDLEKIKLDETDIKSLADDTSGVVDPLRDTFSAGLANQIIATVNRTNMKKASMAGRAAAISQFDESLAALTLVDSSTPDYKSRLRYAERLLEAEQKYLSVQSLRLFDGVHNGEIGAQVRDMLQAEYKILEQRRDLARRQNTATALAILGAVAAGGVIATNDDNTSYGEMLAIDALIRGAIFAGQHAYTTSQTSKAVGNNYLSSIIPALEEQTSIQVSLIDSNETITAIRFEDLSAKLQVLYNDAQRSLDTVATRCGYMHDGSAVTGTWLGVCEGGLANGSGVGVLRNADRTAVEYYGYARNGRPQGAGYLILHAPNSSVAMEGNFDDGRANGTMRVSQPGSSDQLREYQNGQDVGAAASGARAASPFTPQPVIPATPSPVTG